MCLAIPSKITTRSGPTGVVDMAGNRREVNLTLLPDALPGDYVLIHAGFAISMCEPEEAHETLKIFAELATMMEAEEQGSGT